MLEHGNASSSSPRRRKTKARNRGAESILRDAASSVINAAKVEQLEARTMLSTTLTVNTMTDPSTPTNGTLSLREALAQVQATPGTYIIDVPAGDYPLDPAQGTLTVADPSHNVTITATDGTATIDAQSSGSVIEITSGTVATLSNLTLTGGLNLNGSQGGGGIFNNGGDLTLNDSTITGNSAFNGGAIYNSQTGTATVNDSTFNANYGVYGGAINNAGTLTLTNATIANNSAANVGGITSDGRLQLNESTVSGNSADSGAGGIFENQANAYLYGNIIADDSGTSGEIFTNSANDFGNSNLTNDGSPISGDGNLEAEPLLAPLGNYGGNVDTMALLPGSPALESGDSSADGGVDARGVTRSETDPDMGAYESQGFVVTTTLGSGTQSTAISASFQDLSVHVVANDSDLTDLTGGVITFTAPGSGASATLGTAAPLDSSGDTSITAVANSTTGGYVVTASAAPTKGTLASFDLTNTAPVDATINITGGSVTYDGNDHAATATATGSQGEDLSSLLHIQYKLGSGDETSDVPVDAGTYNIYASFDGNASYNAVADHDTGQTIVIGQASPIIDITGATATYNNHGHAASGTATGVESTPADLSSLLHLSYQLGSGMPSSTAPSNAGTYEVLYTFSGNTDYASATNVDSGQTITINQTTVTFNFTGATVTFNNAAHAVTGTATGISSQNESSFLSYTYENTTTLASSGSAPVDAGTYEVFATFAGTTNYSAVSSFDTNRQIVINKANATISIHGFTGAYNGTQRSATGTATGLASLSLSSLLHLTYQQGSNTTSTGPTNAGTYEVFYSFDGNTDYNAVSTTDSTKAVVINQATALISVTGATASYDGTSHAATAIVTNVDGLNGSVNITYKNLADNSVSSDAPVDSGTYEVFASLTGNGNYASLNTYDTNQQVVINRIAATSVSITGNSGTFNNTAFAASGTATGLELADISNLLQFSYEDSNNQFSNSAPVHGGTYEVFYSFSKDYTPSSGSPTDSEQTVVISKTNVVINVPGAILTYDGNAHAPAGTATGVGGADLSNLLTYQYTEGSNSPSASTPVDAGAYEIAAAFTGNSDYNAVSSSDTGNQIVINKADASIIITGSSLAYDNTAHSATTSAVGVEQTPQDLSTLLHVSYQQGDDSLSQDAPIDVGNYEIFYSFDGNNDYNAVSSTDSTQAIQITPATVSITATGTSTTYDASPHGATGTARGVDDADFGSGLSFQYEDSNHMISSDAPTQAGTYDVLASWSGDSDYATVTEQPTGQQIVIAAAEPTLNFTPVGGAYTGQAYPASFTATGASDEDLSGLVTLTYNDGDSFINGAPTDAGTYEVYATVSGANNDYGAESQFDTHTQIAITKANANISIEGNLGTYDGSSDPAAASATGVESPTAADLTSLLHVTYKLGGGSPSSSAPVNAGTYEVYYSFDGNGDYNSISSTDSHNTIVVATAPPTINVSNTTVAYNGTGQAPTATATGVNGEDLSDFLSFSYTEPSVDPDATLPEAPVEPGVYEVSVNFEGNPNYTDQNFDSGSTLTITKADPIFAFSSPTIDWDNTPHGTTATATGVETPTPQDLTSLLHVTYQQSDSSLSQTVPTEPGIYEIFYTFDGNSEYNAFNTPTDSGSAVTINKAAATIDVTGALATFDGTAHAATGTATGINSEDLSSGLTLEYEDLTNNDSFGVPDAPVEAGTYEVLADYAGTADYAAVTNLDTHQEVVISQAAPTITVTGSDTTYDGNTHEATFTATGTASDDLSDLVTLAYKQGNTFLTDGQLPTDAGTYEVYATFAGNNDYPAQSQFDTNQAIVIHKADVQISVTGTDVPFDNTQHGLSFASATGVEEEPEDLSSLLHFSYELPDTSFTTTEPTAPGTYPIFYSFDGNADYNAIGHTNSGQDVVIEQAAPTINITGGSATYDGNSHAATAAVTGVNDEDLSDLLTITYVKPTTYDSTTAPTDAGTYEVFYSFAGNTDYGTISNTDSGQQIVISKANADINVSFTEPTFDNTVKAATASATGVESPTPQDLTSLLHLSYVYQNNDPITNPSDAGAYEVFYTFDGNTDYNAISSPTDSHQNLVILAATPTLSATGASVTYDGNSHAATGSATGVQSADLSSGLSFEYEDSGDNISADAPSQAGSYEILADYAGVRDYSPVTRFDTGAQIVINKANASFTVTGGSLQYDGNSHSATASATGDESPTPANLTSLLHLTYKQGSNTATSTAPTSVGTYELYYTFDGNNDYNAVTSPVDSSEALVITPPSATISLSNLVQGYADAPLSPTATTTPTGLNVVFTYAQGMTPVTNPTEVGTYTVTATVNDPNYVGSTSNTFTIFKSAATISLVSLAGVYNGTAPTETPDVTGVAGETLTGATAAYFLDQSGTLTPLGSAPADVGTYKVLVTYPGNSDYATGTAGQVYSITQANPVISLPSTSMVFNASPQSEMAVVANVAVNNPDPVTYTYYAGAQASGTPLMQAPTDAGMYTEVATTSASQDYTAASNQVTFSITQATPVLGFNATNVTYSGTAQSIAATVTGVNSAVLAMPNVTYYAGETASGSPLSQAPVDAGTYTISATWAGNTDYTSVTNTATYTIGQATPTVSVTGTNVTYSGTAQTIAPTVAGVSGSSANPGSATLTYFVGTGIEGDSLGATAPVDAGTYTVQANYAGDNDYIAASAVSTYTISPATPVITVPATDVTYTGVAQTVDAVAVPVEGGADPGAVTLAYYQGEDAIGTPLESAPVEPGTYTVQANYAGDVDYNANSAVTTYHITVATPVVSVTATDATYDGTAQTITPTVTGPETGNAPGDATLVYFVGIGIEGENLGSEAPVDAGTYTVQANYAGNDEYAAASNTASYTISQATPTVSVTATGKDYDGTAATVTSGATGPETGAAPGDVTLTYFVGMDTTGMSLGSTAPVDGGTYTVQASYAGDTDYTAASATSTYTIAAATPTVSVTVTDDGKDFDGTAANVTASATGVDGGAAPGDVSLVYYAGNQASGTPLSQAPVNAGIYTVQAVYTGDDDYLAVSNAATYSIAKIQPDVIIDASDQTYDAASDDVEVDITGIGGGFDPTGSATLTYYAGSNTDGDPLSSPPTHVGTYTVQAVYPGDVNYNSDTEQQTFNITQATPTVTVTANNVIYDGTAQDIEPSVNGDGDSPGDATLTYFVGTGTEGDSLGATAPVDAGTYTVLASYAGDQDYTAASNTATYTISQATPVVSVNATGKTYDGSVADVTSGVTGVDGAADPGTVSLVYYTGMTATGTPLDSAPTDAGTYTVQAVYAGDTDYAAVTNTSTYTISQATATVNVSANDEIYDGTAQTILPTVTGVDGGTTPDGTPSLLYYSGTNTQGTPSEIAPVDAGTYTVLANFAGDTNYAPANNLATYTIYQAAPVVTVTGTGKTYDGSAATVTSSVTGPETGAAPGTATLTYFVGMDTTGTPLGSTAPTDAGTYTVLATYAGDQDYAAGTATSIYTIAAATPVVSITGTGKTYDGTAVTITDGVTGAVDGAEPGSVSLVYYSGEQATGTPLDSAPVDAGTYTAQAVYAGDNDYIAVSNTVTYTIAQATPTVNVTANNVTYSGTAQTITPTVTGAGESAADPGVATLTYFVGTGTEGMNLGATAPVDAGTYTVQANYAGDQDYAAASNTATYTIAQATATVAITAPNVTYNAVAQGGSAVVTGLGGAVLSPAATFTYYSGSVASGTPLDVTPVDAGTYTVVASFAGNTDYGATSSQATYTIAKATPSISLQSLSGIYNGSPLGQTPVVLGVNNVVLNSPTATFAYYAGSSASGTPLAGAPVDAGTYTEAAAFAGNNDYTSVSAQETYTIGVATPVINLTASDAVFTGVPYAATFTQSSVAENNADPVTLTYYVGTHATGTPLGSAPTDVGLYTVLATSASSQDYNAASSTQTFSITQATPTVSITAPSVTYDGSTHGATASAIGVNSTSIASLTVIYYAGSSASGTPLAGAPTEAGTYTVSATYAATLDYTTATNTATYTISQATPTVSVTGVDVTYSGTAQTITPSVTGAGALPGSATLLYFVGTGTEGDNLGATAPVDAGTYTVQANYTGDNDYTSGSAISTYTIGQATPTVNVSASDVSYTGVAQSITAGVTGMDGGANPGSVTLAYYSGETASGDPLETAPIEPGTYTVLASYAGDTDYIAASNTATYTIGVATPIVTVTANNVTYDGTAQPITPTVTGSDTGNAPGDATLVYFVGTGIEGENLGSEAPVDAGTYTVQANYAGNSEYSPASSFATYTIGVATPVVTVTGTGKTYDGSAATVTSSVTGPETGAPPGDVTLTYFVGLDNTGTPLGSTAPTDAGTYTVEADYAGDQDYAPNSATSTYTIAAATPVVSISGTGKTYDGTPVTITDGVTGVVDGADPGTVSLVYYSGNQATGTPLDSAPVDAGTYTAQAVYAGDNDYVAVSNTVTYTITQATPTVSVTANNVTYDGTAQTITPTVTGVGGAGADPGAATLTYFVGIGTEGTNLGSTVPVDAGTYTVQANYPGDQDYTAASNTATYTIAQAAATVTVTANDVTYDGTAQAITPTVTGVGGVSADPGEATLTYFVGNDTTGTSLGSTAPVDAGTYTVEASYAGDQDYIAANNTATYTIGQATPTVSITTNDVTYDGTAQAITPTVTGVGGVSADPGEATLTYFVGNDTTGTSLGSTAPVDAGTYTVEASYAGDQDYIAADNTATYSIGQATPTVSVSANNVTYDGTAQAITPTVTGVGGVSADPGEATLTYFVGNDTTGTSLGSTAPVDAGTYTVEASYAGDQDYAAASNTATYIIGQATPTISVAGTGKVYDGTAATVTSSVTGPETGAAPGTATLTYYSGMTATGTPLDSTPTDGGTYTVLATYVGDQDYTAGSATSTYTIAAATPVVSISATGKAFDSTPVVITDSVTGVPDGANPGSVTLVYYAGSQATGTPLLSAPTDAGTYTAQAVYAGDNDYVAVSNTVTYAITQATTTVSVSANDVTYDGTAQTITPVVGGVGEEGTATLTYFVGDDTTGTSLGSVAPVDAGTYTVLASYAGNQDFAPSSNTATYTIAQATPTVGITASDVTYSGTAQTVVTTVTGVGGVSADPGEATLTYFVGTDTTGSSLGSNAPIDAGTYTVEASYAGDQDYIAVSNTATYTIAQATPTVSVSASNVSYTGIAQAITAGVTGVDGGANPGLVTLTYFSGTGTGGTNLGATAPVEPGIYTIQASYAGDQDYAAASNTATYSIGLSTATVSVSANNVTYSGDAQTITPIVTGIDTGNAPGVATLTYFVGTDTTGTSLGATAPVDAGTYTILASYAGDSEYGPASNTATYTIAQAAATVSVTANNVTYTGDSQIITPTVTGVPDGIAPGSATLTYYANPQATGDPLPTIPTDAGTWTVLATYAGSQDYLPASSTATYTISQATPVVNVTGSGKIYDATPATISSSVTGATDGETPTGLTLTYFVGTGTGGTPLGSAAPVDAGTYTVQASYAGDGDYTALSNTSTYSITAATPTITVTAANSSYTGLPVTVTPSVTGVLNGANPGSATLVYYAGNAATGTPLATPPVDVDTYTVQAVYAGSQDYLPGTATQSYAITPASSTVSVAAPSMVYTGLPESVAAIPVGVPSGANPGSATLTYYAGNTATGTPLSTPPVDVGTYTVLATYAGDTDYAGSTGTGTYSITAAAPTVSVTAINVTYTGLAQTVTDSVTGVVSGANPGNVTLAYYTGSVATGTPLLSPPVNVGSYTVQANYAGDNDYSAASNTSTYTIAAATPTLSITAANVTYDGHAHPATDTVTGVSNASLTAAPLVYYAGSLATGTPLGSAPVNAGTYTVTAAYPAGGNYGTATASATYTISQAALTISALNQIRNYGAANPTLSANYSGFVNSETSSVLTTLPALSTTATPTTAVGTAPITASGAVAANYSISYVAGSMTIRPAPLSVTFNNASRAYGLANPTFTSSIVGLANSDGINVAYTTSAIVSSAVGQYTVTPVVTAGQGVLSNYTLTATPGTLNVTAAATTTTLTSSLTSGETGQSTTLTALISSTSPGNLNGIVNFYNGGTLLKQVQSVNNVATLVATLAQGTAVTAYYLGNSSFAPNTSNTVSINVFAPPTAGAVTATAVPGATVVANANVVGHDGSPLTLAITSQPAFGTASIITTAGYPQIEYVPSAGVFTSDTFTYKVTDGHGGTASSTVTITYQGVGMVNSALAAGTQDLVAIAPGGNNTITFSAVANNAKQVKVSINNVVAGTYTPTGQIFGLAPTGNDTVQATGLSRPVFLYGGTGNDTLLGGTSNDILVGGAGHDYLDGKTGHNIVIGGSTGGDTLKGSATGDILVAGVSQYDAVTPANESALETLLNTWIATKKRPVVGHPAGVGGANGGPALSANTIAPATDGDILIGSRKDWYFGDFTFAGGTDVFSDGRHAKPGQTLVPLASELVTEL